MAFNPTHIVVVESGWVFATESPDAKTGQDMTAKNAKVIRRWGTTNGLAQLAIEGPTGETQLEPCSIINIPANKVLFLMDVSSNGWGD